MTERKRPRSRRKIGEPLLAVPSESQKDPEIKTRDFFAQDVVQLAEALQGRVMVSQIDGKMIRIDNSEGWMKQENDKSSYLSGNKQLRLSEMPPGTIGVFPYVFRKMRQTLISALSGNESGACVRIKKASRFDRDNNVFVQMPREGDISNYFGFQDNEAVTLRFLDNSEILYFTRGEDNGYRVEPSVVSELLQLEEANKYLRDLVK